MFINYRGKKKKKKLKNTNRCRLNNTLLNNQEVTEEIKEEWQRESMTTQNLWDAVKAVLSGKFTAIQAYLKKQEKHQKKKKKNLILQLKQLEREQSSQR